MSDTPTTAHGLLTDPKATLDDRRIVAAFDDFGKAREAHRLLTEAGIPEERLHLRRSATEDTIAVASTRPPDNTLTGNIRETVEPDHGTEAYRDAVRNEEPMLIVNPLPEEVDRVVDILAGCHPLHFDPRLERWRNSAG